MDQNRAVYRVFRTRLQTIWGSFSLLSYSSSLLKHTYNLLIVRSLLQTFVLKKKKM